MKTKTHPCKLVKVSSAGILQTVPFQERKMDQSRYHETIMVRIQEHCQSCIGEVEAQTHMLLYELCYISHQYPGRNINNLFMYIFEIKKITTTTGTKNFLFTLQLNFIRIQKNQLRDTFMK